MESLDVTGFWKGKHVLLTGHTGFKGSWLSIWLTQLGASVHGFALEPDTEPALFKQLELAGLVDHQIADIRDPVAIARCVTRTRPDVVFHIAAQPLVLRSYREPVLTWQTNVIGTINLLEALRGASHRCAVVVATTDKVYENREWNLPYTETDRLGGYDPYSASKAAAELAIECWRRSFLGDELVQSKSAVVVASARAGNAIGGGDWAENRIVPDIARSLSAGKPVDVRNPAAVRPWQHVLEPLSGYLRLAQRLYEEPQPTFQSAFNFGPEISDFRTVRELVEAVLQVWSGTWRDVSSANAPHEAGYLKLNIEKARTDLGWRPRWDFGTTIKNTVEWYRDFFSGKSVRDVTLRQIEAYGAL
jgi:CDP-glucose 4,6-dehydratase